MVKLYGIVINFHVPEYYSEKIGKIKSQQFFVLEKYFVESDFHIIFGWNKFAVQYKATRKCFLPSEVCL